MLVPCVVWSSSSARARVCVAEYVHHLGRPLLGTCVPQVLHQDVEVRAVVDNMTSVFDVGHAAVWTMINIGPPPNNHGVGFYSGGAVLLSCPVAVGGVWFLVAAKNA